MGLPKPIATGWKWLETVHTAHWLGVFLVESSIAGVVVTWVATVVNQIPLAIAMVYGLFGAACVMLIAVSIKQVRQPHLLEVRQPVKAQTISDLPALAPVDKAKTKIKRYAVPDDTNGIDVSKATNKELGGLLVALANDIEEIVEDKDYDSSESDLVALFNKHTAPHFLWAYEEVRNRGHRDSDLDRYFEDPSTLKNVRHLSGKLKEIGSRLPLYMDT